MCGIAGYSLSPRSEIDRTRAAQALLAAIAERGADAVGYAHRSPSGSIEVHKERGGASAVLEHISIPADAAPGAPPRARLHEGSPEHLGQQPPGPARRRRRDPQRAHRQRRRADGAPRLRAGTPADDRRLRDHLRRRRGDRLAGCAVRGVPGLDGDRLAGRARARAALPRPRRRPPALGRHDPPRALLRLHASARSRSPSSTSASACASGRLPRGRSRPSRAPARCTSSASRPIRPTSPTPSPPCARPTRASSALPGSQCYSPRSEPSRSTSTPSSLSRSRTRYWNVDHAPRRASNIR